MNFNKGLSLPILEKQQPNCSIKMVMGMGIQNHGVKFFICSPKIHIVYSLIIILQESGFEIDSGPGSVKISVWSSSGGGQNYPDPQYCHQPSLKYKPKTLKIYRETSPLPRIQTNYYLLFFHFKIERNERFCTHIFFRIFNNWFYSLIN